MFKHNNHVVSKTITIKEKIYERLLRIKRDDESFSDLLERLADVENPMVILTGLRGSLDLGDSEKLINDLRERRENWRS